MVKLPKSVNMLSEDYKPFSVLKVFIVILFVILILIALAYCNGETLSTSTKDITNPITKITTNTEGLEAPKLKETSNSIELSKQEELKKEELKTEILKQELLKQIKQDLTKQIKQEKIVKESPPPVNMAKPITIAGSIKIMAGGGVPLETTTKVPLSVPLNTTVIVKETSGIIIPFKSFLFYSKELFSLEPMQSFVIFTHRPLSDGDRKNYSSVCRHWAGNFETLDTVKDYAPKDSIFLPFYWLTTFTEPPSGHGCGASDLFSYDYARASVISSIIGSEAKSEGPLLVLRKDEIWYILDISRFDPVDVKRAFIIWKQQITYNNISTSSFNLVKFKEYFRALVEVYGGTILKATGKVG